MLFSVQLTDDAARDLEELCDYVERRDAPGRAEHLLERIEMVFDSLSAHPHRGKLSEGIVGHRDSGVP